MKKRKNGFTLIELLAVLVVLAIIALIAIPIVVNIISDSRSNSNRRSVDNYGKSLEYAISRYMSSDKFDKDNFNFDNLCSVEANDDGFCPTDDLKNDISQHIDYRGKKMNCKVKFKEGGGVIIKECKIGDGKTCVLKDGIKKYNNDAANCYTYETDVNSGSESNSSSSNEEESADKYIEGREYSVGEEVTFNDEQYYVLSQSAANQDYVTLLKAEPLSYDEVNEIAHNNNLKIFYGFNKYDSYIKDAYSPLNRNGYAQVSYFANEDCSYMNNYNSCTADYNQSIIKIVLDAWVNKNFNKKSLKKVDGYKIRLIKREDLEPYIETMTYNSVRNVMTDFTYIALDWIIRDDYGSYWTMTPYDDGYRMLTIDYISRYTSTFDWITKPSFNTETMFYAKALRPVINVNKSND